jgi:hypothetical protein
MACPLYFTASHACRSALYGCYNSGSRVSALAELHRGFLIHIVVLPVVNRSADAFILAGGRHIRVDPCSWTSIRYGERSPPRLVRRTRLKQREIDVVRAGRNRPKGVIHHSDQGFHRRLVQIPGGGTPLSGTSRQELRERPYMPLGTKASTRPRNRDNSKAWRTEHA